MEASPPKTPKTPHEGTKGLKNRQEDAFAPRYKHSETPSGQLYTTCRYCDRTFKDGPQCNCSRYQDKGLKTPSSIWSTDQKRSSRSRSPYPIRSLSFEDDSKKISDSEDSESTKSSSSKEPDEIELDKFLKELHEDRLAQDELQKAQELMKIVREERRKDIPSTQAYTASHSQQR